MHIFATQKVWYHQLCPSWQLNWRKAFASNQWVNLWCQGRLHMVWSVHVNIICWVSLASLFERPVYCRDISSQDRFFNSSKVTTTYLHDTPYTCSHFTPVNNSSPCNRRTSSWVQMSLSGPGRDPLMYRLLFFWSHGFMETRSKGRYTYPPGAVAVQVRLLRNDIQSVCAHDVVRNFWIVTYGRLLGLTW